MLTGTYVIDAATVRAGQITVGLLAKFFDLFRQTQVFRIEVYGSNYRKRKFIFFTVSEEGEKVVIELRGKPSFCLAVLAHLERRPLVLTNGTVLPASSRSRGNLQRFY